MIKIRESKAITLITLVITIVILIIITGIAISMTIGEEGLFKYAKEAKRLQIISEAKEKIGAEILTAQVDAIERNEELEQAQVEDIISKYGELQEDKDTIILKDNNYTVSLLDIYSGTMSNTGSYTENKVKIEQLESEVKKLQEELDELKSNSNGYKYFRSAVYRTMRDGDYGTWATIYVYLQGSNDGTNWKNVKSAPVSLSPNDVGTYVYVTDKYEF